MNFPSTSPLVETVKDGVVDVDNLIFYYANAYGVPVWADIDNATKCNHCCVVLKNNKKHICRLDGRAYCSQCTTKMNIPEQYEQKQKSGATRVCYGCRMGCLRIRQASEKRYVESVNGSIFAPVWQEKKSYTGCLKCAKKVWSPHNCRCCGGFYCDDCSNKMDIDFPLAFNKKNKTGPQRVCDGCRYRVIAGATLSEEPYPVGMYSSRESKSSDSDSIVVSTLRFDSNLDSLLDIEQPLRCMSLQSASSASSGNGASLNHQDRAALFAQKRGETNLSLGPKVMLDTTGIVLRKVTKPDTELATTPGAPTVVHDASILYEENVKPSNIRRTVAEGCTIPVPYGKPLIASGPGIVVMTNGLHHDLENLPTNMPIRGNYSILPKNAISPKTHTSNTQEDTENEHMNV